jgi:Metallo-beta-lactamase superfamily
MAEVHRAHDIGLDWKVSIKQSLQTLRITFVLSLALSATLFAQTKIPEWCRTLPRPEYETLQRVRISDPWYEVYKVAPAVYAIYEPHQFEETISYLIVGDKQALLFDTGMGIGDLRKVTAVLTRLPIVVLNSHTHNDHVGDNWQFETIYGMDTDFTRKNAQGSREDAQAELAPDQICGQLPKRFDPKTYATPPWKITAYKQVIASIWAGDGWKSSPRQATRRTPSRFSIARTACSSRVTPTIPGPSGYTVPKQISTPMVPRSGDLPL